MRRLVLSVFVLSLLTACGGDGSSGSGAFANSKKFVEANKSKIDRNPDGSFDIQFPDNNSDNKKSGSNEDVTGFYEGTTSNNLGISGLIDEDKNLWFSYADNNDNNSGLIFGSLNIEGNEVKTLAKDYNLSTSTATDVSIVGSVKAKDSFNGYTMTEGTNEKIIFTTSFQDNAETETASLSKVVGTYTSESTIYPSNAVNNDSKFTISADGKIQSTDSTCAFSGNIKPVNLSHANYYKIDVTFNNSTACSLPGKTITGVSDFDSEDNELVMISKTTDLSQAMLVVGYKQ